MFLTHLNYIKGKLLSPRVPRKLHEIFFAGTCKCLYSVYGLMLSYYLSKRKKNKTIQVYEYGYQKPNFSKGYFPSKLPCNFFVSNPPKLISCHFLVHAILLSFFSKTSACYLNYNEIKVLCAFVRHC